MKIPSHAFILSFFFYLRSTGEENLIWSVFHIVWMFAVISSTLFVCKSFFF